MSGATEQAPERTRGRQDGATGRRDERQGGGKQQQPDGEGQQQGPGDEGRQQEQGRPLAEWVSFGIAAAILLAVAGLVVYYWLAVPQGPTVLTAAPSGEIREVGGQFYVPFVVVNSGGNTAAGLRVVAELRAGGAVVERGEQVFNYLAGGERQEGTFVFRHDPRLGELTLGIGSYRRP